MPQAESQPSSSLPLTARQCVKRLYQFAVTGLVVYAMSISAQANPNQCYKDTDCKGERICEQGACTSPEASASAANQAPAAAQPALLAVDELQQALIAAMTYDHQRDARVGDAGAAIRHYAKAGLVNLKPETRQDYSDYRRLKQAAAFLGHELLVIEEEYMGEYVGCCVSPGVAVLLKLNPQGANLGEFISGRGCSLSVEVDDYYDIPELKLPRAAQGSYVEISCKERDVNSI